MIWDYTNNRPLGPIRELSISPNSFREEFDEWFEQESERGVYNENDLHSVRSAIESVGYDLHDFMHTHAYNMIPNAKLREYFLVYQCLGNSPSMKFITYDTEEFKTMGDVDILFRARDMYWCNRQSLSDFDIYCRYYFCETEEDMWDVFADGVGNLWELCRYYDSDKDKKLKTLQYIYGAENKYIKATTGKSHQTCPQSVKDEIVSIIKEDFLNGMDEDFFDEENYKMALFAWNLCIPEIKQEFVKDDYALKMLKRILQETI